MLNTIGMARVHLGDRGGIDDLGRSVEFAEAARAPDDLHTALETILKDGVRELLVVDEQDQITGFLDEAEITSFYHTSTASKADGGTGEGPAGGRPKATTTPAGSRSPPPPKPW